jgi:outer membrane protein OmpA-like peptidoglycan-associated protein
MIKARRQVCVSVSGLIVFVLVTSGCASKKYVRNQVAPVNQRLSQFEKQTNDRLAWLNNKQKSDMSQLSDRLSANDQKLDQVAAASAEAQQTASQAQETASRMAEEANRADRMAVSDLESAFKYRMVDKSDITFAFNKATLTPEARATLDQVAEKCQTMPRAVVELAGFADRTGSKNYNLALSRQRAWAVQRYLVDHNVPIRSIHTAGFGEERPPQELAADFQRGPAGKRDRQERRVSIRVFDTGVSASPSSGSQQ